MNAAFIAAACVSALAGGGMFVNEMSHGALSETMGLGHHHMFDYGGYHCVAHDDAAHGPNHVAHMHGNATWAHEHCPGGAPMHDGTMGPQMMNGTGRGPGAGDGTMPGGMMDG